MTSTLPPQRRFAFVKFDGAATSLAFGPGTFWRTHGLSAASGLGRVSPNPFPCVHLKGV